MAIHPHLKLGYALHVLKVGSSCPFPYKMEFRCLYQNIEEVLNIIKSVHPYEEPIINVLPLLF